MNLFIEPPHRASGAAAPHVFTEAAPRVSPEKQLGKQIDLDEPPGFGRGRIDVPSPESPYSQAQDSYRKELAFDKRRRARRKRAAVLRVVAYLVLLPVFLAAVFLAAYAVTCILNGATPDELADLMAALLTRCKALLVQALS